VPRTAWYLWCVAIIAFTTTLARSEVSSDSSSRCLSLKNLSWSGITVITAEHVPRGTFAPVGHSPIEDVPAFCRVLLISRPTTDSNIQIEVWMPEDWNGRFLGTGSGGGGGKIWQWLLALGTRRGYATANTDLGTSPSAETAIGHPEKWIDFGYRATHQMTVIAKRLIERYYNREPQHSYFLGCSTGGQQALMEAQRYPIDYDGIVAGAPANNRTHLHTALLWNFRATNQNVGSFLPPDKIALITKAVVESCRGKDGGTPKDNFLTDPRVCKFDPEVIPLCQGAKEGNCLTIEQRTSIEKIYAGATNPRTGQRIYAPLPLGSENSASGIAQQEDPAEFPKAQFYQYMWVFGSGFTFSMFDFDHDQETVDAKLAAILNANNPNLSQFQTRGRKLLMFTGTADPIVPFPDALNFYERVVKTQSQSHRATGAFRVGSDQALSKTQDFFRYFLIPGMGHCGNGPGLNDIGQWLSFDVPHDDTHDILTAMVKWVEDGHAPSELIATGFVGGDAHQGIRFERPVCSYPMFPTYISGDPDRHSSYQCRSHPRDDVLVPAERYLQSQTTKRAPESQQEISRDAIGSSH
jgi:feruloyl esterase